MSWIKSFMLFSVSAIFSFCLLIVGDWFIARAIGLTIDQKIARSEAATIEDARARNEDVLLREKLISEGFLPMIFPALMDGLDTQFPLIAGLPLTKTYYCNEGYGLVTYQSDRFGFRNKDTIWEESPEIIMIGDSFVHGACVSDEETLPQKLSNEIKADVVNLGINGNGPSHYLTYAHLFIPRLKPQMVYLNFYANDNGIEIKSSIERKYIDLKKDIFANTSLSFFDTSFFFDEGMRIIELVKDEQRYDSEIQKFSIADRAIEAFKRHVTLPTIKSLIGITDDFNQTEQVITKILEICEKFHCKLIVSYIPNSEFFRPDHRADRFADKVNLLTSQLGIPFVDGREVLNRNKNSDDFAIKGPHLSPIGYEKMAKAIAEIKFRTWRRKVSRSVEFP